MKDSSAREDIEWLKKRIIDLNKDIYNIQLALTKLGFEWQPKEDGKWILKAR